MSDSYQPGEGSTEITTSRDLVEFLFTVPAEWGGRRIDHYIKSQVPRLSRAKIQKMLRMQEALSGRRLWPSMRVAPGQRFRIVRPAPIEPEVPRTVTLLYQDIHIIALNKPAGLPVHPTATYRKNTLTALVADYFQQPFSPRLVHRLDRESSGVILLANSRESEVSLKRQLAIREVGKTYWAIVNGDPGPVGIIDLPIGPDEHSGIRIKQCVRSDGLAARTRYRRLQVRHPYSLIAAYPESGRQHQIRVHLAALGHSIIGDKLYGERAQDMLDYLASGWTPELSARLHIKRHALHARSIRFKHPANEHEMAVEAPLPAELIGFCRENGFDLSLLSRRDAHWVAS